MTNVDLGRYGQRIVQFFWDPVPRNDEFANSPIWCLGKRYESRAQPRNPPPRRSNHSGRIVTPPGSNADDQDSTTRDPNGTANDKDGLGIEEATDSGNADGAWPSQFLDDFEARIWLTYRSQFPPIPRPLDPKSTPSMSLSVRLKTQLSTQTGFTSDTGWGCMIRSGQSLLANALLILKLGRDWRRGSRSEEERRLLALFADDPRAPFSIHKFVEHGASACGKQPGEWFGPSATASCIKALSRHHAAPGLRVHVTRDGSNVYENSLLEDAQGSDTVFHPTLLLLGIRLGIDRVTPVYWEPLKALLQLPQSVGIAGGRPSSSHYFVGTQGQTLFYLDPHQTRTAFPLLERAEDYSDEEVNSCHSRRLRRIHIREMDPSMLIAFLIRDKADWQEWRKAVCEMPGKAVIHVTDQEPTSCQQGVERESAIDEVEVLDDEED